MVVVTNEERVNFDRPKHILSFYKKNVLLKTIAISCQHYYYFVPQDQKPHLQTEHRELLRHLKLHF